MIKQSAALFGFFCVFVIQNLVSDFTFAAEPSPEIPAHVADEILVRFHPDVP
jgi:hypothetical protein